MKAFNQTMYEEVFSRKVGNNPPLLLNPEEVPIIAQLDEANNPKSADQPLEALQATSSAQPICSNVSGDSDEEIKPENYLFGDADLDWRS
jgi:hypothetical protein